MARPLRIEVPGGRYHVTARGNERRNIYRDNRDREHFQELLAQLPERFGVCVHAYVLMANHYHLLLETAEGNLSRTGQWLNVSYGVWFNRRHGRSGHVFGGRFAAVIIEDDRGFQEIGRYMHLNPVRVMSLGLGKRARAASKVGLAAAPTPAVLAERLKVLRDWRWSSYPAYAGYRSGPEWLTTEVLGRLCGGRTEKERRAALRAYTEGAVRQGLPERPWDRLIGSVVLGTEEFARRLKRGLKVDSGERSGFRRLEDGVSWEEIVRVVEAEKGERWEDFRENYGDWGRDAALWLGRRAGRLRLGELGRLAGGISYAAVGTALGRFERRLREDRRMRSRVEGLRRQLSKI